MKAIVIAGNPVEGFRYYGPFDDTQKATDWAEDHRSKLYGDEEYWISLLFSKEA